MTRMIRLKIKFNDLRLDAEERHEEAKSLVIQLNELDEITSARLLQQEAQEDAIAKTKAIDGGVLAGLLAAEVSWENFKSLINFLGDRLSNKSIELEVEINGRRLQVKAASRQELEAAVNAALVFVYAQGGHRGEGSPVSWC
jgi:hypothetical protein